MTDWRAYSNLVVGDTFPEEPHCFVVTEEIARSFRDLTAKSLVGASKPEREGAVPPMLAAVYIRGAQNALKGPPGGIHAKQHFTFLTPVHVGDRLDTTLTIKDKYERKGRPYVVTQTRTRNQDGVEVTLGEMVLIWGRGMSAAPESNTPIFPVRIYRVDQALVDLYAQVSGDHNPLHTDPAFAATTMFGRTIAHGMMTLAFLSESLETWVGPAWPEGGAIDVTFLSPVYPGDEVNVSGTVTGIVAGIATCAVECSVGERKILAGTARWPVAIESPLR